MATARITFAVLLLLLGTVFVGQGIGVIKGSFMTGSPTWLVIGALIDLGAAALLVGPRLVGGRRRD